MKLTIGDHSYEVQFTADGVTVDGETFRTSLDGFGSTRVVTVNGRAIRVDLGTPDGDTTRVTVEGQSLPVRIEGPAARPQPAPRAAVREAAPPPAAVRGAVTAQMTGRVVRVVAEVGATVGAGDLLLILEAMKMENEIRSPRAGTVKEVRVTPGDRVNQGDALVVLE
jgi:biotin carboxyl carrier protein